MRQTEHNSYIVQITKYCQAKKQVIKHIQYGSESTALDAVGCDGDWWCRGASQK